LAGDSAEKCAGGVCQVEGELVAVVDLPEADALAHGSRVRLKGFSQGFSYQLHSVIKAVLGCCCGSIV